MPNPRKLDRPVETAFSIPTSVIAKVRLELHSEIEGRVPHGAMSKLVTELMVDWLKIRGIE